MAVIFNGRETKQETGNRKQEAGNRKQETENGKIGDRRRLWLGRQRWCGFLVAVPGISGSLVRVTTSTG